MRYVIWNNKGGVGKTFLSYCMATEYAIANPEKRVAVIDMCPQTNLTELILGGNGTGQTNQNDLFENELTIAGYIKKRYEKSRFGKLGTETQYFCKVQEKNSNMPGNLFLLAGDIELDLCAKLIERIYGEPIRGAKKYSLEILKDIVDSYDDGNTTFFIDCSPSLASYTQIALVAADKLIIPCTADFASIRGIQNIAKIIYGKRSENQKESIIELNDFYKETKDLGIKIPHVSLLIVNKSRSTSTTGNNAQANGTKTTAAYKAHVDEIESISTQYWENSDVIKIKDANNLALVINYTGIPVSKLEAKQYTVYGKKTQVSKAQIELYKHDLNTLIKKL